MKDFLTKTFYFKLILSNLLQSIMLTVFTTSQTQFAAFVIFVKYFI